MGLWLGSQVRLSIWVLGDCKFFVRKSVNGIYRKKNHISLLVPNDYSCKDTFSFVSQIKNAKCLFSYDVTSLFTNIPFQETIGIAINFIFNHNPNLNITRKDFAKIFLFATSQAHFIFNSKFYNQIDGVAMGSP